MLIAFSGLKGSGKDTCAAVLLEEYGFTKIAFADAVRDVALAIDPIIIFEDVSSTIRLSQLVAQFGWDKIKREIPEVRRLLQVIGTEAGRNILGENIWVDYLFSKYPDLAKSHTRYVITDCRFMNEVSFVQARKGTLVWVDRPGVTSDGHSSESVEIRNYADYVINNDDSILELQEDIRLLLHLRGIDRIE